MRLHKLVRRRQVASDKWGTIQYAIDSTARTVRLCVILLVASVPPWVLALLIRH